MMPRIFRSQAEQFFLAHMEELKNAGFDAIGVGSMEEPGFLRKHRRKEAVFRPRHVCVQPPGGKGHEGLWGQPGDSSGGAERQGAFRRRVRGELIVYGYLPMMVSAQCVKKTMEGWHRAAGGLISERQKGKGLPGEEPVPVLL